jgi:hypothetical protein
MRGRIVTRITVEDLAFAMYAQQREGGVGSNVNIERARLMWAAEDVEQYHLWRSKARGVLSVLDHKAAS